MKKFLALPLAFAIYCTSIAYSQVVQDNVSKDNRTIAITSTEDASATADIAEVEVGYTTYGTDSQKTYADAAIASNKIINALLAVGVLREAIVSSGQDMNEIESGDKLHLGQGYRYYFEQRWNITVGSEHAAKILQVAIQAGAIYSGSISWEYSKSDELEAEAAEKALAHAREVAEHMANGLNAHLGTLVYASNQTPPRGLGLLLSGASLNTENGTIGAKTMKAAPIVIQPDTITKSATVYAVFSIE